MNGAEGNPNSGLPVSQPRLALPPLQHRQVRAQARERAQGLERRRLPEAAGRQQWGGFPDKPETNRKVGALHGATWAAPDF